MLFDLRGRGRRRTIKAVYLTLAFLLGGGLVLFGIGGDVSGGLVDAITERGASGDTGTERFEKRERDAARRTRANARDAPAWAELARVRVQVAGVGENFDPNTNTYTESGKAKLTAASEAWKRYLDLDPPKPDDRLASLMVQAYSEVGLNQPTEAVRAQQIITEARPKAATFAQLAIFAYQAGDTRTGDLARRKALQLSEKDDRNTLKSQLDQAKQQAAANQVQQQTPSPEPTVAP